MLQRLEGKTHEPVPTQAHPERPTASYIQAIPDRGTRELVDSPRLLSAVTPPASVLQPPHHLQPSLASYLSQTESALWQKSDALSVARWITYISCPDTPCRFPRCSQFRLRSRHSLRAPERGSILRSISQCAFARQF